ncbi:similar to Saccharomyces cerevisiae YGR237C Putative protein of unknown function [Maudiozyma saulgeensis]|uniref:Uncharacterized protein n=1 Tax=Maudiozyma saulgeensis TaxID=1789683 RepID=A0A1X7RA85_9SACH|nr:similar to Saccharomyces cerevisiae YGR237C Putative protein of unknown function [Kazachstania saulgeensis]
MTTELPLPPKYKRHISFDNLSPSLIDDEIKILKQNNRYIGFNNKFFHIPPQYNPLYNQLSKDDIINGEQSSDRSNSLNDRPPLFGESYSQQIIPMVNNNDSNDKMIEVPSLRSLNEFSLKQLSRPLYKTSSSASRSESPLERQSINTTTSKLNFGKLPPPPDKSILKKTNRAVDEQGNIDDIDIGDMTTTESKTMTKLTNNNTQLNSGSKAGYTQSLFSNLNEVEDRIQNKNRSLGDLNDENSGSLIRDHRRKSFANMTDAELAALENSYISLGRSTESTMDQFDFGKQNPVFFDNKKASSIKIPNTVLDSLACVYPSRPSVDHKALSLTMENEHFQDCVNSLHKKLNNKYKDENGSLRVVSCYISGRRFTWSTVDWYIENFVRDGDHLVIITCIPDFKHNVDLKVQHDKVQKKKKELLSIHEKTIKQTKSHSTKSGKEEERPLTKGILLEGVYEEAKIVGKNLLEYYAARLSHKKIKITIEMVKDDSTKSALTKVAALYKPSVHIVATVSANIQIKFRNGNVKLPFFVMKHYTIPVIVVPFEFIDRNLLIEGASHEKSTVTKDKRLDVLDNIIHKTLHNPFLHEEEFHHDNYNLTSSDDEESVASVNEYFPISTEQQRKINLFEQLGYIFPLSTREKLLQTNDVVYDQDGKKLTPTTSRNSRRSSRVQFQESGLYKVKSMIDGVLSPDEVQASNNAINNSNSLRPTFSASQTIRKTKSVAQPSSSIRKSHHHHRHNSGNSKFSGGASGEKPRINHLSSSSSRDSSSKSKIKTKVKSSSSSASGSSKNKKSGIGSIFKKFF